MTVTFPDSCLIQFAKAPQVGNVKTRLHPALGAEGATNLHKQLLNHSYKTLTESRLAQVWLTVAGEHAPFFEHLTETDSTPIFQQQGEDLGERMYFAASKALAQYRSVIIVGSDCPFIDRAYLERALSVLASGSDVVLGPAADGGYVLLGLNRVDRRLFADIEWGGERVLAATRQRLLALNWQWQELETLPDIDRPEDLNLLNPSRFSV